MDEHKRYGAISPHGIERLLREPNRERSGFNPNNQTHIKMDTEGWTCYGNESIDPPMDKEDTLIFPDLALIDFIEYTTTIAFGKDMQPIDDRVGVRAVWIRRKQSR